MKRLILVLLMCCMLLISAACSNPPAEPEPATAKPAAAIVDVTAKPLIAASGSDTLSLRAAGGANDFAFALTAALLGSDADENFLVSPYSVWLPLAALANAANPAVLPQLLDAIGASGLSVDDINNAASGMLYRLTSEDRRQYAGENNGEFNTTLKIANAVFVDNSLQISREFVQKFADYYRGAAFETDFSSEEAVRLVNAWASDNTEGLIDKVIEKFDSETVAAIANAIYFSDRWNAEFNESYTAPETFHRADGDSVVSMMRKTGRGQEYYEDELIQAMNLRFYNGGGMLVMLPKSGSPAELLSGMTAERFSQITQSAAKHDGTFKMPRFEFSNMLTLNSALEALGVPLLDKKTDPITGLVDKPLYVTSAVQKALIKVDEKGTTAAAVTVMQMVPTSDMPQDEPPFEMTCDHPFAFILYGASIGGTEQILFTGVVNNPQ